MKEQVLLMLKMNLIFILKNDFKIELIKICINKGFYALNITLKNILALLQIP